MRRSGRIDEDSNGGSPKPRQPATLRLLNILLSGLGLIVLSPVMAAISLAIRLDSRGPIIYRQRRVGLDRREREAAMRNGARRSEDFGGRPFQIFKFRTMMVRAESETGPVWAAENDIRVTRVGKWLRSYRLDEIPQLVNVLLGDMSIVGPRPERPDIAKSLAAEVPHYRRRHRVLPGITGWAQVNLGYDTSLDDVRRKLSYDLEYIENRSIALDVRIMLLTVPVILRGRDFSRN